jgi:uncharacterized protein YraI
VHRKLSIVSVSTLVFLAGCGMNVTNETVTSTPDFITATLPETSTPAPTGTALPPTPQPTFPPVAGTTTTQLNVRSEPSTAGDSLGTIDAFSRVQILGKESNGAWYQIIHPSSPDGKGWVTATYVQVDASAEVHVIPLGSGLSLSGLVIGPVNVRKGPATSNESLGTLSANDVVSVIGRDSSGAWLQVQFKGQTGWAATEFLQVDGVDGLPVTAQAAEVVATGQPTEAGTAASILPAVPDHDTMGQPAASLFPSSASDTFQFNGNVSSPAGDAEDWLQFTWPGSAILLEVNCTANELRVELWKNGQYDEQALSCTDVELLKIEAGQVYHLRMMAVELELLQVTNYELKMQFVR